MNNYRILIQYDGSVYAGWQVQLKQQTVQQKIADSIEIILKGKINLIGSGRTDAGVHALGQVANFRTDQVINPGKFLFSLNSILPHDIAVLTLDQVNENFHSRFDAKKRIYAYIISKYKSAFYYKYSYFYHNEIDCAKLNLLSQSLIGRRDFTSFSKTRSDTKNKICEIFEVHWKETKGFVLFYISADRYLHGMVRSIVGTLLYALKNDFDRSYIENVIKEKRREAAAETVPARGLFLFKVKY